MQRETTLLAAALAASLCACKQTFPVPFTGADLVAHNSGAALTHYLSQRDASPAVCDPKNSGPHITRMEEIDAADVVDGLISGQDAPELWKRCADALVKGLEKREVTRFLDAQGIAYKSLLKDSDLDIDPKKRERLEVLHQVFLARPPGVGVSRELMADLTDSLAKALANKRLGPTGTKYGTDVLATVELERGSWQGKPVTEATLDELQAKGEEKLLGRFALRLPDASKREQAKRRIIRMRIARSSFPEVKEKAREVEDIVVKEGRYPVSAYKFPPKKVSVNATKMPVRGVIVRQKIYDQTSNLFAYAGDKPGLSVLPELQLRGAISIELGGISKPVTLCGPKEELDPTPCVVPEDVKLGNPMAYLDRDGAFHFADHVKTLDAVGLLQQGGNFTIPIAVGGRDMIILKWDLWFEKPEDLVFSGRVPGGEGPPMTVAVDGRDAHRAVFTATVAGKPYVAILENQDVALYRVVTRGGVGFQGPAGARGHDGPAGAPGQSASCPSTPATSGGMGAPGGPGGGGGPGGPGGRGGDIVVTMTCGSRGCDELASVLRKNIISGGGTGGPGGQGGPGGTGGPGGSGGSGTSCSGPNGQSTSLPSGSTGTRGADGTRGLDGPPGPPGTPGRVNFAR